jgi:hypothetical protein
MVARVLGEFSNAVDVELGPVGCPPVEPVFYLGAVDVGELGGAVRAAQHSDQFPKPGLKLFFAALDGGVHGYAL